MNNSSFRNFFNSNLADSTLNNIINNFINNRVYPNQNNTEEIISYIAIYDMYETEKAIFIYVDLPGIDPSTIQVDFFNNKVDISAKRVCLINNHVLNINTNTPNTSTSISDNSDNSENTTVDNSGTTSAEISEDEYEDRGDREDNTQYTNFQDNRYLEHHKEIVYGKYTKRITLPFSIIKKESIKVTSKFGVLIIEIDKENEERNRFRVPVSV